MEPAERRQFFRERAGKAAAHHYSESAMRRISNEKRQELYGVVYVLSRWLDERSVHLSVTISNEELAARRPAAIRLRLARRELADYLDYLRTQA